MLKGERKTPYIYNVVWSGVVSAESPWTAHPTELMTDLTFLHSNTAQRTHIWSFHIWSVVSLFILYSIRNVSWIITYQDFKRYICELWVNVIICIFMKSNETSSQLALITAFSSVKMISISWNVLTQRNAAKNALFFQKWKKYHCCSTSHFTQTKTKHSCEYFLWQFILWLVVCC